ncbi:hypothetical protein ACEQ8H_005341 [Pleosporales sp. CAS-2024a]
MFSGAISRRVLTQTWRHARYPTARRLYATEYEQRTNETLKTSSRLTWLTSAGALGAAALYYATSTSTGSPSPSPAASDAQSVQRREKVDDLEAPKAVEDRHGDSVAKHSIAAHKNENKMRQGKFSGKEFDNHVQKHSPGNPGGDFEKK